MKKKLLSIFALSIFSLTFAQVGIGTKTPDPSAVLDVNASTTKGGLLFPKVTLTASKDTLTIKKPAAGLVVYSDGLNVNFARKGNYIWNGAEWLAFDTSAIIDPTTPPDPLFALVCTSATLSPSIYKTGQAYNGTLTIPYLVGNGAYYNQGDKDLGPVNGLYYRLRGGKLNVGDGNLTYTVSGTPVDELATKFPIDFFGTTCSAELGTGITINTISYSQKTVPLNVDTTTKSETKMGNLRVRYNSGTQPLTVAGYIEFTTIEPTHVTWVYHKGGSQMANIEAYGRTASSDLEWSRFMGMSINGTGGPSYADQLNVANLNPGNRDIGYATLTLHNTGEVYRVTLNASAGILANAAKKVPAADPSVTIYIERLEATK